MINGTLLKKEWKSNWKILLIFMGVLALYAAMITGMYDPSLGESLRGMMESMPQLFSAFGMSNPGTTLLEFLVNYLYGFLLVVFPMVFLILLCNRLVSRYVDRGSMVFLLATPNRRARIIRTQILALVSMDLCLVIFVTLFCILCSQAMFPGELEISRFILVNAGLWGLHIFLGGLCFLCSCLWSDSRRATGMGAGFCIAFLLIQMISQAGETYEALRFVTPLTLFRPEQIISAKPDAVLGFLVLFLTGFLFFLGGGLTFCRKDLSI